MLIAERIPVDRFQRLNHWWVPFAWVLVAPLILKLLNVSLFVALTDFHLPDEVGLPKPSRPDHGWHTVSYEYFKLVPAIITFASLGLLNLTPFLWSVSRRPGVRIAGIIAGLFGLLHLLIPMAVLFYDFKMFTGKEGVVYFHHASTFISGFDALHIVWAVSATLVWYCSAVAWWVFGRARNKTKTLIRKVAEAVLGAVLLTGVALGVMMAFFFHFSIVVRS